MDFCEVLYFINFVLNSCVCEKCTVSNWQKADLWDVLVALRTCLNTRFVGRMMQHSISVCSRCTSWIYWYSVKILGCFLQITVTARISGIFLCLESLERVQQRTGCSFCGKKKELLWVLFMRAALVILRPLL